MASAFRSGAGRDGFMVIISLIAVIFLIIDQVSKILIVNAFGGVAVTDPVSGGIPIIDDVLYFSYQQNEGAAFGIMQGARWIFIPLTIIVCGIFIWWLIKTPNKHMLLKISSGLMLSGAVGNLIDRAFLGYVRDFIYVNIPFATFNIADSCLVIGTILMGIYIIFIHEKHTKRSGEPQADGGVQETGQMDGGSDEQL